MICFSSGAHGGGDPACGAAATHDCFTTGGPGCTDEVCCNTVCAFDSYCCGIAWDGICVGEAVTNCDGGGGNPACGASATHDCYTCGSPGCTDEACCNVVCAIDTFCCMVEWDNICVSEAVSNCASTPPANDNCSDAIQISGGDTPFHTMGATTDGPPTSCDGDADPQINQDVWFDFTPITTNTYTASLCGSEFDTKISVYGGCACPPGRELACNDDSCGLQSEITWDASAGECFKIRVGGHLRSAGLGHLIITARFIEPCTDPNNHACNETGAPGCNVYDCCTAVCALDPFCCNTEWDQACIREAEAACQSCTSDINADGTVNAGDLLMVINAWGPCAQCAADVDGNGVVNSGDLLLIINNWEPCS